MEGIKQIFNIPFSTAAMFNPSKLLKAPGRLKARKLIAYTDSLYMALEGEIEEFTCS